MKIVMTGLNGTVAPVLAGELAKSGHDVAAWDRSAVAIDDPAAIRGFLDGERPEWFFHVATGPAAWAESIALACAARGIRLLYTSSVSVFSDKHFGPIGVDAIPDATEEYGRYKAECESRIRRVSPQAMMIRLGWQIGNAPGSNNMIDYLHRTADADGRVEVSQRWFPACSFLQDTADAVCSSFGRLKPGIYHLDGNPSLSLYEIAVQLNKLHGDVWTIVQVDEPERNNLMVDEYIRVRSITDRFA